VYEGHGQRLVKIRNPWGRKEWTGAWGDGSKEWTAEWLTRLNHQFGDDGIFWMTYKDMLSKYKYIDRTRIFGRDWHVAQQWMSVQVPWSTLDYQTNYFSIAVPEDTDAVIVLSQLDDRYFKGLQGKYNFTMQFRVQKDDDDEEEYLSRSKLNYELVRSVNVELHLTKGTYTVLIKVEAQATGRGEVEDVIRKNIHRRDKITQIGMLYDLAHQKGQLPVGSSASASRTSSASTSGTSTPVPGGVRTPASASPSIPSTSETAKKDEDDIEKDPNRNPWNASCVVGLRVYSKQSDLGLKVIVPSKDEVNEMPTLDRDDVAKSAMDEVQAVADKVDEVVGEKKEGEEEEERANENDKDNAKETGESKVTAPKAMRDTKPVEGSDNDGDDDDDVDEDEEEEEDDDDDDDDIE
jgi:hypothetical protein